MPFTLARVLLALLLAASVLAPASKASTTAQTEALFDEPHVPLEPAVPLPQPAPEPGPSDLPHAVRVSLAGGADHQLHVAALVDGGRLSDGFGQRAHTMGGSGPYHSGIDIAAPRGAPVRAAAAGRIIEIGRFGAYGRFIRIRHGDGLDTAYAHLAGFAEGLRRGQRVRPNQVIGFVGTSGRSTGPHLHFEVMLDGEAVDPLSFPPVRARG